MQPKLENYETVKQRKKRFYEDHPDGRIIVDCQVANETTALFKASVYLTREEQLNNTPKSTGYAQEFKGQGGFANKFSWTENCEESAVGRALDNAGYAGNDSCSREEMMKVQRHENSSGLSPASPKQKKFIADLIKQSGRSLEEFKSTWESEHDKKLADINWGEATRLINELKGA